MSARKPAFRPMRFSRLNKDICSEWVHHGQRLDNDKPVPLGWIAKSKCRPVPLLFEHGMSGSDDRNALRTAFALHQAGRLDNAARVYRQVLTSNPGNFLALHYLGVLEASFGNFEQAKSFIARSVEMQPSNISFLENYATVLSQSGDYGAALQVCRHGLEINDRNVSLIYVNAVALYKLKRSKESVVTFDKLLAVQPGHVVALNERASVLADMNKHEAALASCEKALALQPQYAEAHLNVGNIFAKLRRYDEALAAYDKALMFKPAFADAWLGRGNVLVRLGRYNEASAAFDRALSLNSDLSKAWLGRGNLFARLKRHNDALAAFDKALALDPQLGEAWLGRGIVFSDLNRQGEALDSLDRALALNPDLARAWFAQGNVLTSLGRRDEAFVAFDRALSAEPEGAFFEGARLYAKMHLCDWSDLDAERARLLQSVRNGIPQSPFALLSVSSSPADQLRCAKSRNEAASVVIDQPLSLGDRRTHDRIRVAYLSSNFCDHPVAHLAVGLFENHDKSRFEVTGISFGPRQNSIIQQRIRTAFERFVEVQYESDEGVARLVRRLEIDIAVDLMGFTEDSRVTLSVLGRRPAPLQVSYLGYAGTSGADYIDYIIADPTVIPSEHVEFYSEKVVWLPNSYQANDNRRHVSEFTPERCELGLPERGFVFCCFNNMYKLTPEIFDVWMRLLRATEGSVLWLARGNEKASGNLQTEAVKRGVSPERLIFAAREENLADHLARLRRADLFLDTLPFNAHTTASDALWAGLPVLTCLGSAFPGRVAASLLKAAGLEELIATSLENYEALALRLARDESLLALLKAKLSRNRDTCALFDTPRFTRHLEAAYVTAHERGQAGLAPDHIVVPL